ncbi:hypothetical protein SAMN04489859_10864 [Paracoccus alcaliphilus]|uniref:Concanavalin A-like lectin/glucanases superfamily protein n=1 Tax=Paracoccus alcaliphilus TaxID=34002 RepID=A0A1H8P980_9RHOB|nr:hypothetical protein [Paracoccus alcaliphilus]WCR19676.1 hypothetical protein JHW40_08540 [Paracoccus alcaliphilus]SEO38509.1 hypothetical protein SAMN04489859_10864 [Paracoccus alcaliphilus]
MPINFTGDASAYPDSAFFPDLPSLDDTIAQIPGLLGAWDARDYSGSGAWAARVGSGTILPAAAGSAPTLASQDGRPVLRFGQTSKAFVNDATGASVPFSGLVFATRAYYADQSVNFQKVFVAGSGEFYFRATMSPPRWQWAGLGSTGQITSTLGDMMGWNTIVFEKQGTAPATLTINGSGPAAIGFADAAMSGEYLVVGDPSNVTSCVQNVSRMIICNTGELSVEHRNAIRAWVNG